MFKSLLFVTLLVPSCVYQKEEVEVPKHELPHVETLENSTFGNQVFGAYNLKDTYENAFYDLADGEEDVFEVDIDFFNGLPLYSSFVNVVNELWYLKNISIYYDSGSIDYRLDITYYTTELNELSLTIRLCDDSPTGTGNDLSVLSTEAQNLIIYTTEPILLNDFQTRLFNAAFTSSDNAYTFTYSGYYNLMTTSSMPLNCNMYGNVIFDSSWYYCLQSSNVNSGNSYFDLYYRNINTANGLLIREVALPNSSNILLSGCKMTRTSYTRFSSYGTFSYVYVPTETSFSDMIFTVMDTPIYFLSSLLSFELFGVNMFIAFTGLLTLCMILLLIRKFF